jgi:hypothetical protein
MEKVAVTPGHDAIGAEVDVRAGKTIETCAIDILLLD